MPVRPALLLILLAPAACWIPDPDEGGQSGEHDKDDDEDCVVVATEVIDLDTPLADGTTPRQVLAVAEGDHEGTFTYRRGDATTGVTTGVTYEGGEVRRLTLDRHPEYADETGLVCASEAVEIDVVLHVYTEDGAFAESSPALLTGGDTEARAYATWETRAGSYESEDALHVAARFGALGDRGIIATEPMEPETEDGVTSQSSAMIGEWE